MNTDFNQVKKPALNETLERLRIVSGFENEDWLDLLQINWKDYALIRAGVKNLPEKALSNLSGHFNIDAKKLINRDVDFKIIQIKSDEKAWELPYVYSYATHGRSRTTITSFDYLEKFHGWRVRYDVLKHLGLSESILTNPFDQISMKVITDAFAYMAKRQFRAADFYTMGMYTYVGNANTILAEHYAKLKNPQEILEHMIGQCLQFYEKNCIYRFIKFDQQQAVVEVMSDPRVADEMNVRHLGNEHICCLKAGWLASVPLYLGQQPLKVVHTSCVHKGDPTCRFEITFPPANC